MLLRRARAACRYAKGKALRSASARLVAHRAAVLARMSKILCAAAGLALLLLPLAPGFTYIEHEIETKTTEGVWTEAPTSTRPSKSASRIRSSAWRTKAPAAPRARRAGGWSGANRSETSLVVDPPDGRMPPMTPDGQARTVRAPRGTMGNLPLNAPEDFTYWERCISRGALGSTLPVLYNSGIDITQGPDYVGIRYEMVHDVRIIAIDRRPHVSPKIPLYMGDARARWDGDTLVVE